jgi:hypothetical protein
MSQRRSLLLAWSSFFLIVFVLFNSCASHREQTETGRYLAKGTWTVSPALLVRVLRTLGTDDGDMARYLAYSQAVLGRPYQSYYIRSMEEWRQDASRFETGKDISDPVESPPATPPRALTPYRDFSVEYPPGFFLFALPPALLISQGSLDQYSLIFGCYMGLLLCASLWLSVRSAQLIAPELSATRLVMWSALCLLALGPITLRRYDAVVSLSLCLLIYGCLSRRALLAGIGLAIGVAAKGLPILLTPLPVMYYAVNRRWRELAVATTSGLFLGLLIGLPFAAWAGPQLFDLFRYHGGRPIQIESTAGALLVLSRLLPHQEVTAVFTFGSLNLAGPGEPLLRSVASALPVISLLAVWLGAFVAFRRAPDQTTRDRSLIVASCLILVGQMALGKVFSPQYLTWLLPLGLLACLFVDARGRWLMLVAMGLTPIIFPIFYDLSLPATVSPIFGLVVLIRNLCLLGWALLLLVSFARRFRAQTESIGTAAP